MSRHRPRQQVLILEAGPSIRTHQLPELAGAVTDDENRRAWITGKKTYTAFYESRFPIRSIKADSQRFVLVDRDKDDLVHLECGPAVVEEPIKVKGKDGDQELKIVYRWGSPSTRVRAKTRFKMSADFGKAENARPSQRGPRDRIITGLVVGLFVGCALAIVKFVLINWSTLQGVTQ